MNADEVTRLFSSLDTITKRLDDLESARSSSALSTGGSGTPQSSASSASSSQADSVSDNIRQAYESLKESVKSVKFPVEPAWQVKESRKGVASDHLDTYYVIRDCARFVETTLKYLICLDPTKEPVSEEDIANLSILCRAQILYLEDKYASVRVRSSAGKKAGDLFETQVAGTSGLTPRHLQVWQTTAQIAAAGGFVGAKQDRGRGGFGRGWRRPGRGGRFNNNFNTRGDFNKNHQGGFSSEDRVEDNA